MKLSLYLRIIGYEAGKYLIIGHDSSVELMPVCIIDGSFSYAFDHFSIKALISKKLSPSEISKYISYIEYDISDHIAPYIKWDLSELRSHTFYFERGDVR